MHIFWIPEGSPAKKVPPLPPELINVVLDHMPRSDLTHLARVSKTWYAEAMPRLYRHLHIVTPHHWECLVRTMEQPSFSMGKYVQSLVLRPSPKLAPSSRFADVWKQHGAPQGYVRVHPIDFNRTGLENMNDNYPELDTTQKEAEWLSSVSSKDMATVLNRCTSIDYIDVGGCERLGDEVVSCTKELKGLFLPLVRGLTPTGLANLATKINPSLRYVDLSFCLKINDDALINAVECWPNLTHLRLNSLYHITNASIAAIAQACPSLKLLYLVRCWQVTNDALAVLAQKCPDLVYVSVAFLSRTTEEGVGQLVKQLPKLKWIDITGCGINSLFKPMIIQSWTRARLERGWDAIQFNDSTVALL
ncbi:hypothetical protein BJV82DRAFT_314543 [Fennellomyces sp. T-0311]|nr:hypothetical protein BJV82DRAFT_314543 [Fennellomyces sp. T-0311]